MVLLQKLPPTLTTFGEISDYILQKLTKGTSTASFFVTDNYVTDSIKAMERERRTTEGLIRIVASRRDQLKPRQFNKYLRNSQNKIDLIKFLISDWSINMNHAVQLEGKELFVTVENKAFCITANNGIIRKKIIQQLESEQEEADTKMFLCALYAEDLGFGSVKIITVDSDVAILAMLLGEHETLTSLVKEVLEEYVCKLYGVKDEANVNNARYKIFTKGKKIPIQINYLQQKMHCIFISTEQTINALNGKML